MIAPRSCRAFIASPAADDALAASRWRAATAALPAAARDGAATAADLNILTPYVQWRGVHLVEDLDHE